jgi:Cu+-exporting ATPase
MAISSHDPKARHEKASFGVRGMTCASCVARVERTMKKLPGVLNANVNLATEKATVDFEPGKASLASIKAAIQKLGYEPVVLTTQPKNKSSTSKSEESQLLRDLIFAGILTLPLFLLSMGSMLFPALQQQMIHILPKPCTHIFCHASKGSPELF